MIIFTKEYFVLLIYNLFEFYIVHMNAKFKCRINAEDWLIISNMW